MRAEVEADLAESTSPTLNLTLRSQLEEIDTLQTTVDDILLLTHTTDVGARPCPTHASHQHENLDVVHRCPLLQTDFLTAPFPWLAAVARKAHSATWLTC
jgi:hypothetical protein